MNNIQQSTKSKMFEYFPVIGYSMNLLISTFAIETFELAIR